MKFKITAIFLFVFSFSAYAHQQNKQSVEEDGPSLLIPKELKTSFQFPSLIFQKKNDKSQF